MGVVFTGAPLFRGIMGGASVINEQLSVYYERGVFVFADSKAEVTRR